MKKTRKQKISRDELETEVGGKRRVLDISITIIRTRKTKMTPLDLLYSILM